MVCGDLFQLADFARLATPLARFGKVDRAATNQEVGSSNPPGRTILLYQSTFFPTLHPSHPISFHLHFTFSEIPFPIGRPFDPQKGRSKYQADTSTCEINF
jgi:hypothetical protein